jgi:hypothetical protein
MSDGIASGRDAAWLSGPGTAWPGPGARAAKPEAGADAPSDGAYRSRAALDPRRRLQLVLGGIWLLDAVLQYQSFMFTRAFARMLAESAQGNPAFIAGPVTWSARLIDHHVVVMNAVFATIQLLLGLGIAWRPTVRVALGASVVWALAVWWLGEGLGLLLTGDASPANGAPGAVIIYALLAVLLWPARADRPSPFVAGRAVGARAARLLWLVLWASLAYLAVQPAARAPQGLSSTISGMAAGEPRWLASMDSYLGGLLSHRGLAASVVLAAVLAVIAVGVYLPPAASRAVLVLAVVVAAALWVAEGLGEVFTGTGTDPNTGPLLALLAVAYWPAGLTAARHRQGTQDRAGGR